MLNYIIFLICKILYIYNLFLQQNFDVIYDVNTLESFESAQHDKCLREKILLVGLIMK